VPVEFNSILEKFLGSLSK